MGLRRLLGLDGFSLGGLPPSSAVRCRRTSRIGRAEIEEAVSLPDFRGDLELLTVGRGTYAGDELLVLGLKGSLTLGRYCSLGSRITFVCGEGYHRTARASTYPFPFRPPFEGLDAASFYPPESFPASGVTVGHDVWIGHGATIAKGVTIGHGAVIAAGAVVTKDVPPYGIAAGNPAEVRRIRHEPEVVEKLLKLAWWDWAPERIAREAELFRAEGPALRAELNRLLR